MSHWYPWELDEDDFPWVYEEPVSNDRYTMYHGTTRARAESIQASGFSQSPDHDKHLSSRKINMSHWYPWELGEDDFPWVYKELVSNDTCTMYHGTTRARAESIQASGFSQSPDGMLGRGVYLSREWDQARCYPIDHPKHDRVVITVVVYVGNVIAIDCTNHPYQRTWHEHGYDTAWVPPNCGMVKSGLEECCVWDPRRVKIHNVHRSFPIKNSICCNLF